MLWMALGVAISFLAISYFDTVSTPEYRYRCGMGVGFLFAIYTIIIFYVMANIYLFIEAYLFHKKQKIHKQNGNLILALLMLLPYITLVL